MTRARRSRLKWFLGLGFVVFGVSLVAAMYLFQNRKILRNSPSEVNFVTEDIPRFWAAFDKSQTAADPVAVFQHDYLEPGSVGLQDFLRLRIESAQNLSKVVKAAPKFFAAIRQNTLSIVNDERIRSQIRQNFERIKALHPKAKFQDVYFLIGVLNTAGTGSQNGQLLGVEMLAKDATTPMYELPEWNQQNNQSLEGLPFMVTHEQVHTLQEETDLFFSDSGKSLLWNALHEGGADFVAALASNEKPHSLYFKYGLEHEKELWVDFKANMLQTDLGDWFYGQPKTARPADLGYFMGYRILEAFYNRASDKQAALEELLAIKDPIKILENSGYAP
jgi:Predicted Zn-dependent protease (DUF2268)